MATGIVLSQRDAGRVQDMLRWFERNKALRPDHRRRMPFVDRGTTGACSCRRAQTTQAASGLSVTAKLLNAAGVEAGDEITVNFFFTTTDSLPEIGDNKVIPVFQDINGAWYCPLSFIGKEDIGDAWEWNHTCTSFKAIDLDGTTMTECIEEIIKELLDCD